MALTCYSFPLLLLPLSFWPILSSVILLLNLPAAVKVTYSSPFPTLITLLPYLAFAVTCFIASSIPSQFLIEKAILTQSIRSVEKFDKLQGIKL